MRKYLLITAALTALVAVVLAGCSDQQQTPTTPDNSTTATQMPDQVRQMLVDNAATTDRMFDGPSAAATETGAGNMPDWGDNYVYSVTFVWGSFPIGGPMGGPSVDWSGSLTLTDASGNTKTVATIDFEDGEDMVLEQTDDQVVEWESFTSGDVDGLSFLVFVDKASSDAMPASLTFTTAPYNLTLSQEEMSHYLHYEPINTGDFVAVMSKQLWRGGGSDCPGGHLSGTWHKYEAFADSGYFDGDWMDRTGATVGQFSARYWTTEDGDREFAGDITAAGTDDVIGELNGKWAYSDMRQCPTCGAGKGWFRGEYTLYATGDQAEQHGYLAGEFGDLSLPFDALELPLNGLWHAACSDQSPDVVDNMK